MKPIRITEETHITLFVTLGAALMLAVICAPIGWKSGGMWGALAVFAGLFIGINVVVWILVLAYHLTKPTDE